jgi:hypothetical protein
MPATLPLVDNPYERQLASFSAGTSNARRGLIDIYKLRRRNIESHFNEMSRLYGGAKNTSVKQYGNSIKALAGYETQGLDFTKASGYQVGQPDVAKAVKDIIGGGVSPYRGFLGSESKATAAMWKGYKGAEQYEDKTLKTGLAKEKPAALSELEQGIIDVQSNLQTQAGAFAQQQAYLQSMQSFQNQMLGYQRQMAQGAMGTSQGGGTGKETPNTLQWLNYAAQRWGVTVGGWRAHGSVPGSDHPHGRAIDVMASGAMGQAVANDFVANAGSRGVKYVIYNHQIWTPSQGWHRYNGPNPHTDHAHISFLY